MSPSSAISLRPTRAKYSWFGQPLRAVGVAFLGVDEHQVDVRRDVELAPAELAHADHHQRLRRAAGAPRAAGLLRLARLGPGQRGGDRGLGQVAHRAADLGQVGRPGQIARHHPQQHALAQPAQAPLERGLVVALRALERGVDLRARERLRLGELGGELGPRLQHVAGVARRLERRGNRGEAQVLRQFRIGTEICGLKWRRARCVQSPAHGL